MGKPQCARGARRALHWIISPRVPSLPQRFQYEQVPGNHYVHMNQPQHMAGIISSFLQSKERIPAHL